jgi:23S rRNA (adenine2503-C2)-methyltransferase
VKIDFKGMDSNEIESWVTDQGFKPYRGRQIRHWLFNRRVSSFKEMTNLPDALMRRLGETAVINHLEIIERLVSKDDTTKYLFRLNDGNIIETALIPERNHFTLCVSSQVGCSMACRFCFTAKQGFIRNLTAAEIIDQVIAVKRLFADPDRLTNVVFMGMGEPLANYDAVVKAVGNLVGDDGLNFSRHKITLSTCGLVPRIREMGSDLAINLAVSLNAADDETRSFLMPINRKHPLGSLISACRDFPLTKRRIITFEYILIKDVNDGIQDAKKLCALLSGLKVKINLITLNPHPDIGMSPASGDRVWLFQEELLRNKLVTVVRKSKGADIMAACGQLSGSSFGNDNPLEDRPGV